MTDKDLTPESFAEQLDFTLEGTEMVAGVEVAEYTDENGDTLYTLVYMDGNVDPQTLSEVWKDGNYAFGRSRKGDLKVMLDDDGVHRDW
jgi:predicted heme/steroid binding protein